MNGARALSRRDFFMSLSGLGALVGTMACSKETPFSCMDTAGLPADDLQVRLALAYVDTTRENGKDCSTCQQFVPAGTRGSCGTCKVMKGPVHPRGYCKIYVPKA